MADLQAQHVEPLCKELQGSYYAAPEMAFDAIRSGVATVSIYGQGADGPEKRDTRFLARMPESGMKTLLAQIADQVV